MKYGVISTQRFEQDLLQWDSLYIAGRLHKPVLRLRTATADASDRHCEILLHRNLLSALRTSLLLLPETFTEFELFSMISSLSYDGDIRMGVGENPMKV